MNLGVLFSGGKDSTYALFKAMEKEKVSCLISIISKNKESYMFHTPNIEITKLQAKAIGIPLIRKITLGKKEEELEDLKKGIKIAKEKYKIDGIVTGGVESIYQAERFQKVCNSLNLWCFNPLWLKNQKKLLEEIIKARFKVIITGIFAYPLSREWLGKEIKKETIKELVKLKEKYSLSISGEGGEIETTVLDAPFFKKKIEILDFEIKEEGKNSGVFLIKKAILKEK